MMYLNLENQRILIKKALSISERFWGLMGQSNFHYGMLFQNCNAIHTFFMKEPIDVIGLNLENKVIYIYRNLPKNQILKLNFPIKKTSILELPQNTSLSIQLNEHLFFEDEDII